MRDVLEMVLMLPIVEVKKVITADSYGELREVANESERIVLDSLISQLMREMEVE